MNEFEKEFNDDGLEIDYDMNDASFTHIMLDLFDSITELERLMLTRDYLKKLEDNEQIVMLIADLNSDIKCKFFNLIDAVISVKFELIHRSEQYLDGTWSSNVTIHKDMLEDYLSPN